MLHSTAMYRRPPGAFTTHALAILGSILLLSATQGVTSASPSETPGRVKVGAFNIQAFGQSKMSDPPTAARIAQICGRYDVILLQEIRDSTGWAVNQLLSLMNQHGPYNYVISERLGRTSTYKEQYAFFYRTDRILNLSTYQYADVQDYFEREPFVFLVKPMADTAEILSLIALHSKPTEAVWEIGNLTYVISSVYATFGSDVLPVVLGDLNADCTYASLKKRQAAGDALTLDDTYHWLIGETVDTTSGSSHCAYDRVIVTSSLLPYVEAGSSQAYNFCDSMNLTALECTELSDHYPVETVFRF